MKILLKQFSRATFSFLKDPSWVHSLHQVLHHPNDLGAWVRPMSLVADMSKNRGTAAARELANSFLEWFDTPHRVDEKISIIVHQRMDSLVRGLSLGQIGGDYFSLLDPFSL